MRRMVAQTRTELLLTLRRGESLLVAIGIPVAILLFFTLVDVLPHGAQRGVDFLVPGVLALSIVSSALVSLSIATAFERRSGVLRRLALTPLGRGGVLGAKAMALGAVLVLQLAVVAAVGRLLGWRPEVDVVEAVIVGVLGLVAFAGLGFCLAGLLRAETNLAVANGAFLVLLLLGGIVVPVGRLPGALRSLARVLPAEPLASSLRAALGPGTVRAGAVGILAAWALLSTLVAVRTFRLD